MNKRTLLPRLSISLLIVSLLPACSLLGTQSSAATPEETQKTAYYLCGGCHGPKNVRVWFMSPNIIGQKKAYLAAKLKDYRDKKRISPMMNGVAVGLSDQDIDNLADYFANNGFSKN